MPSGTTSPAGIRRRRGLDALEFIPKNAGWKAGPAGFGYGDDDDATVLKDMQGKYTTVYVRNEFELDPGEREQIIDLGLVINYDDAFIAYLNGHEVLRVGVEQGAARRRKITRTTPRATNTSR